ncbi:MAG TPA: sugar phosphate nucleotidyltransferase [Herpetosiphonaceae bacterium]
MRGVLALIMAGGESPALSVLTHERSAAAVPFAGKYRIIDFALSNCVNSGIYDVGVLTQHYPRSLHEHIGVGKPWDLDRIQGGVRVLHPWPTRDGSGWQRGTADAIRYHLDVIEERFVDTVLVLAGDHVYKMDYRMLLAVHAQRGADVTIAVHSVPPHETHRYGMVTTDADGRVARFEEKPRRTASNLASMGIYAFRKQFLVDALRDSDAADFGRELLPSIISRANVASSLFSGYWADVGTLQSFYESNIALLAETPALDLYDPEWVVHTKSEERPAAQLGAQAAIERSLLCDGCRIDGHVVGSLIGPGVVIQEGAVVRDSIIMTDAIVERGAVIDRCILDKGAQVGAEARLGEGAPNRPNEQLPQLLNTGLTVVGKNARIAPRATVGRNVLVRPRARVEDFLESGASA